MTNSPDPDFYGDPVEPDDDNFNPPAVGGATVELDDVGRSEQFVEHLDGTARFIVENKQWAFWEDGAWKADRGTKIFRKAVDFTGMLKDAVELSDDPKERAKQQIMISKARSIASVRAMATLAESHPDIVTNVTDWDTNPWLLGTKNGIVDLKTGAFSARTQDDLMLRATACDFDPAARCPKWDAFLAQILPAEGLAAFMERMLGYSMAGITTEQMFMFLYGQGANGKSTLLEVTTKLLGDYTWRGSAALVTEGRQEGNQDVVMGPLLQQRFLVASEIKQQAKLAEARVKDLTGGDRLQGRLLYGQSFQFDPTHTLWLYGNYKPRVAGTDNGIWRRMMLVPFDFTIADNKKNTNLTNELLAESSGILNRLIAGCLDWQKQGANPPPIIMAARSAYREEEDAIGEFIRDECELEPKSVIPRTQLFAAYDAWCQASHTHPFAPRNFYDRVRHIDGVEDDDAKVDGKKVRVLRGIRLSDPSAFPDK